MAKKKKESAKEVEPKVIENQESVKDWTPPPRKPKHRVAKGKSICCRKGIRGPGDPIEAINVGGEDCLKGLVESGHVEEY